MTTAHSPPAEKPVRSYPPWPWRCRHFEYPPFWKTRKTLAIREGTNRPADRTFPDAYASRNPNPRPDTHPCGSLGPQDRCDMSPRFWRPPTAATSSRNSLTESSRQVTGITPPRARGLCDRDLKHHIPHRPARDMRRTLVHLGAENARFGEIQTPSSPGRDLMKRRIRGAIAAARKDPPRDARPAMSETRVRETARRHHARHADPALPHVHHRRAAAPILT